MRGLFVLSGAKPEELEAWLSAELRRDRLPPVAPDDRRRLFAPGDADCCDGMLLCCLVFLLH